MYRMELALIIYLYDKVYCARFILQNNQLFAKDNPIHLLRR